MQPQPDRKEDSFELRLFLEEICCNVCRFQHVTRNGLSRPTIRIDQEVFLGIPGAFADIRVEAPGEPPYFVEVKYGYPAERIAQSLARKYGPESKDDDARTVSPNLVGVQNVEESAVTADIQVDGSSSLRRNTICDLKSSSIVSDDSGLQLVSSLVRANETGACSLATTHDGHFAVTQRRA